MAEAPIITTVAFTSKDRAAFDAFWTDIRTRYRFCADEADTPTQAFAVSMGDMFAEQEAIDDILDSDLDTHEIKEAIGRVAGCGDLPALLAEFEVTPISQKFA